MEKETTPSTGTMAPQRLNGRLAAGVRMVIAAFALTLLAAACSSDESASPSASGESPSAVAGDADSVADSLSPTQSSSSENDDDTDEPDRGDSEPEELAYSSCEAFPSFSEGEHYLADVPNRTDLRDGVEGAGLEVRLTVVDADGCEPISGQSVELWSAASDGRYSGVERNGVANGDTSRSLRGSQLTSADGSVTFTTVYPGWVDGAAPHLAVTMPIDETRSFTARLLLDDGISAIVHESGPYEEFGPAPVSALEVVTLDASLEGSIVTPTESRDGWMVDVVIAIDELFLRQPPVPASAGQGEDGPFGEGAAAFIGDQFPAGVRTFEQLPGELQAMFEIAADELGIDAKELFDEFRLVTEANPPDLDEIGERLGVDAADIEAALPLVAGGPPDLDR
ncbi:MAG: hypothetical protein AAF567_17605 [Actinomycetota bacterium]